MESKTYNLDLIFAPLDDLKSIALSGNLSKYNVNAVWNDYNSLKAHIEGLISDLEFKSNLLDMNTQAMSKSANDINILTEQIEIRDKKLKDFEKELKEVKSERADFRIKYENANFQVKQLEGKVKCLLKVQEEDREELAIKDRALDMTCNDMALAYEEEKEKYKKRYLEKAKESVEKDALEIKEMDS